MDINTATEKFRELVRQFVNHKDFSTQGNITFKQKQKQLIEFSKNVNSLIICLLVLENDNEPTIIYFASQFVKDKFKFEFEQLSKEIIQETHARLTNIIRSKTNLTKIVVNNLALCLVYLYIHCYEVLGSVMDFFKNTLVVGGISNAPPDKIYYQYLFKYLDGLACQIDNRRLVIDEIKRNEVDKRLKEQQTEILMVMHHIYAEIHQAGTNSKMSSDELENLLYAFAEWLKITNPSKQVTASLQDHNLLNLALASLSDPILSQAASQCLLAAIEVAKNAQENLLFYGFLGQNIMKLTAIAEKQIKNEQFEQAQNLLRVLCQYGTHAGKKLIDNFNENSYLYIMKMLAFTQNHYLQVFKELVDFWESMVFFITNRDPSSPLSRTMADQIIAKLYYIFCCRIMYSKKQIFQLDQIGEKQLSNLHQSVEDVRERRDAARYVFESIGKYLGPEVYLDEIIKGINSLEDKEDEWYWPRIEAFIYSLRDVLKRFVQPTEKLYQLVQIFQQLKDKHIIVSKSILRVYEALFAMQVKRQEFILPLLRIITPWLNEKLLADKAGSAFQRCCKENAQVLVNHIADFYKLLERNPENNYILQGLTFILKRNPLMLRQHLPRMLKGPIQTLMHTNSKKEKRNIFNRLFTIIQSVPKGETKNITQIIEMLLQEMWPIIQQILKEPQDLDVDEDRLIERAVKFLKLVMRSIPQQFAKYLKEIFHIVIEAYRSYPINSYVYLYQVTFTVYYKYQEAELLQFLKQLYIDYCTISYMHLGSPDKIANYQHLVDDFIGLNKRIVTFDTRMFLESGQAKPILDFSIHCLGSGVPRAASSASQLFEIIFMIYWSSYSRKQYGDKDKGQVVVVDPKNAPLYAQLKQFIAPLVPDLLRKMFSFLETVPVQSARDNVLDCFEAVALAFPRQSAEIWTQPLNQLHQDILTQTQKERLKQNLLKLSSQNQKQFVNAQQSVGKLFYTISNRYSYRKSRATNLTSK